LYDSPWAQAEDDHPHLVNSPNKWAYWDTMVGFGKGFGKVKSIADLSCGDAYVTKQLAEYSGVEPVLGDFAEGYPIVGPIEDTIHTIDPVELFVCTNTIEHIEDPHGVIREIRRKARYLMVSCPVDEWTAPSGGHVWAFDQEYVEAMLNATGWTVCAWARHSQPYWNPHCDHMMWAAR
jgi:hypothetical protein